MQYLMSDVVRDYFCVLARLKSRPETPNPLQQLRVCEEVICMTAEVRREGHTGPLWKQNSRRWDAEELQGG